MAELTTLGDFGSVRAWADAQHRSGSRIALVPTMGFLHEGHLALVREAHGRADRVLVSIFVNPTQFGPQEDLDTYPRDPDGDLAKLGREGTHAVFLPTPEQIYPPGFDTYVEPGALAEGLCGAGRPGHFRGVATVVCLLFRITRCDVAVFGQKDYQQLQVIRRMVRDLHLGVEIVAAPIVREADGLAMSSRNVHLTPEQRAHARAIPRGLQRVQEAYRSGEREVRVLLDVLGKTMAESPHLEPEYAAIVDADDLHPVERLSNPAVCAVAARVGSTRLIDNCRLD